MSTDLLRNQLIEFGRQAGVRGWVAAGGGNFSARHDDNLVLISASGRHKAALEKQDFLMVDLSGRVLKGEGNPSAETLLHTLIYEIQPRTQFVLHVHSPEATVLSMQGHESLVFEGYEMLKALPGIQTHQARFRLPVFANDQNISRLSEKVRPWLTTEHNACGFLVAGHGLYGWGQSMQEAVNTVEALEFLIKCEVLKQS